MFKKEWNIFLFVARQLMMIYEKLFELCVWACYLFFFCSSHSCITITMYRRHYTLRVKSQQERGCTSQKKNLWEDNVEKIGKKKDRKREQSKTDRAWIAGRSF